MATVNYSVPDEVKELFNRTFEGRNKSAIIAEMMVRAVEEEEALRRSRRAAERILERRRAKPPISSERIRAARDALRR